jgi:hypothetical protein
MKHNTKEETSDDPPHSVPQTHTLWDRRTVITVYRVLSLRTTLRLRSSDSKELSRIEDPSA